MNQFVTEMKDALILTACKNVEQALEFLFYCECQSYLSSNEECLSPICVALSSCLLQLAEHFSQIEIHQKYSRFVIVHV